MALGGLNDTASTNEELLVKLKGGSSSFTFAKEQKIKVAGQDGLVIDVEGKEGSQSIKGRIALVMASPKQQFTLTGIAPTNRWDEIAPIFDAVLASTTFFQADPSALEPAADTPTEGPSAAEPAPVETVESSAPTKTGPELLPLRQWAISAKASSQYGSIDWAASQATGEPNVPECSDNVKAWASKGTQTVEWIELTYAIPVTPTEINIYQSYNPSQVVEVQMTDTNGKKYSAWTGQPEKVSNCPDLMTISLELTKNILVNKIRITIDQSVFKVGWDEIDSVELVGYAEGQAALP